MGALADLPPPPDGRRLDPPRETRGREPPLGRLTLDRLVTLARPPPKPPERERTGDGLAERELRDTPRDTLGLGARVRVEGTKTRELPPRPPSVADPPPRTEGVEDDLRELVRGMNPPEGRPAERLRVGAEVERIEPTRVAPRDADPPDGRERTPLRPLDWERERTGAAAEGLRERLAEEARTVRSPPLLPPENTRKP